MDEENPKKRSVPALERGLRIMEVLARSRNGLKLSQLTRYLGLPKSSVFCLLRTLEDTGYIYRDTEWAKYRVSLRVCTLAHMALNGISLREQARPHLKRLADSTGLTVHLAVLERGSCILIEKTAPPGVARVATWVGKHLSLHCTAIGKVLAAYLPEEQLDGLMLEQGLLRHNDNTICSPKKLRLELAVVRKRGYAVDDEEEEIGVRCIGAPIFNRANGAVAAVSLVGATTQVHSGILGQLAAQLVAAANSISEDIKSAGEDAGAPASWSVDPETPAMSSMSHWPK